MKNQLKEVSIFPTKEEVFVSITHGLNAANEYKKLDLDNRAKTILDALKGVIYLDDCQVRILLTDKIFLKNQQESYYRLSVKILDKHCLKKILGNLKALTSLDHQEYKT